jgi:hypothetical protein
MIASPTIPARILPMIVISQFAATSLWFANNAVMTNLQHGAGLLNSANAERWSGSSARLIA